MFLAATGLTVAEESNREAGRRIRDIFVYILRRKLTWRTSWDEVVRGMVRALRFLSLDNRARMLGPALDLFWARRFLTLPFSATLLIEILLGLEESSHACKIVVHHSTWDR